MARPLRIEYPRAFYHVMNRGNRKQTVFELEEDVDLFLEKLGEFSTAYQVKVICYCLMRNHFHLYVKTENPNLSKFMQAFLTSFTIIKNRRDHSAGHLFQGRYKAILVENTVYGAEVSRYIHLNPVRTAEFSQKDTQNRRAFLRRKTKLNSYPAVIGLDAAPGWLSSSLLLKNFGDVVGEQRKSYASFVEEGLLKEIDDPMEVVAAQSILGSDRFVDEMRRGVTEISENLNLRRELGMKVKLTTSLEIKNVIDAVCGFYKVTREYALLKNSRNNEARQVLLYLSSKYCRGRYSMTEIGASLGNVSVGAVARSRYNMARKIRVDKKLKARVDEIEKYIS